MCKQCTNNTQLKNYLWKCKSTMFWQVIKTLMHRRHHGPWLSQLCESKHLDFFNLFMNVLLFYTAPWIQIITLDSPLYICKITIEVLKMHEHDTSDFDSDLYWCIGSTFAKNIIHVVLGVISLGGLQL